MGTGRGRRGLPRHPRRGGMPWPHRPLEAQLSVVLQRALGALCDVLVGMAGQRLEQVGRDDAAAVALGDCSDGGDWGDWGDWA